MLNLFWLLLKMGKLFCCMKMEHGLKNNDLKHPTPNQSLLNQSYLNTQPPKMMMFYMSNICSIMVGKIRRTHR